MRNAERVAAVFVHHSSFSIQHFFDYFPGLEPHWILVKAGFLQE
jgi:hypothetical protein